MSAEPSTISTWVVGMAFALDKLGLDAAALFRDAGFEGSPYVLSADRVPVSLLSRVWQLAIQSGASEHIGLQVGESFGLGAMHALGSAVLTSSSLADACRRIERYSPLVSNAGGWVINETPELIEICLYSPWQGEWVHHAGMDAAMALTMKTLCLISQQACRPKAIDLVRPLPDDAEPYRAFFGCPVGFGKQANRIFLPRAIWEQPLPGANPDLSRISDQLVEHYLQRLEADSLISRARWEVTRLLPQGEPQLAEVAAALHCGKRTLQRKLDAAGTSFSELISKLRRDLAIQLLGESAFSLQDISFKLGFASQASFSRAFREWTGLSPSQYRGGSSSGDNSSDTQAPGYE